MMRAIAVAVVVSVVPFGVGYHALDRFAEVTARDEVASMAERLLTRAERVITDSIAPLKDLERQKALDCSPESRAHFVEAISASPFVSRVTLVDPGGYAKCTAPPREGGDGAVAPVDGVQDPLISLSLQTVATPAEGGNVLRVLSRAATGDRLMAETRASALAVDPGPEPMRASRVVDIRLRGADSWLTTGDAQQMESERGKLSVIVSSSLYPIDVTVSVPSKAVYANVRSLQFGLILGSFGLGLVLIAIAIYINWRPEIDIDGQMQSAVRRNEFVPYYQPVINLETGKLEGAEMLARWMRADGQFVPPGRFMPFAETSGHIFEITRQLMRKTVRDLGPFYARHPELKVSINLFAGHFEDRRIIEDIVEIFGGGQVRYDQLVFEVTERYPLKDLGVARKIIAEIRSLGCRVALDDTGTGHGGLAYIQQLGIDIIKIDKMFIDMLTQDQVSSSIVDVLAELARTLDMGVIAEGVESEDQIARLMKIGVTSAQGYLFAPALSGRHYLRLAEMMTKPKAADATRKPKAA